MRFKTKTDHSAEQFVIAVLNNKHKTISMSGKKSVPRIYRNKFNAPKNFD